MCIAASSAPTVLPGVWIQTCTYTVAQSAQAPWTAAYRPRPCVTPRPQALLIGPGPLDRCLSAQAFLNRCNSAQAFLDRCNSAPRPTNPPRFCYYAGLVFEKLACFPSQAVSDGLVYPVASCHYKPLDRSPSNRIGDN